MESRTLTEPALTLTIPEEVLNIGPLLLMLPLLGVQLEAPVLAVAHLDSVPRTGHSLSHGQCLTTNKLVESCYQYRKFVYTIGIGL